MLAARPRVPVARPIVIVSLTVAFASTGCAHSVPEPAYSAQPNGAFEEVDSAPPPARVEMVPKRPADRGAVWIDGEWNWTGRRWAWQYGRWVVPPPGATYSQWATVRRSDGVLLFAPGKFRNEKGRELPSPPALAVARAHDEGVIDAEGNVERAGPNIVPDDGE